MEAVTAMKADSVIIRDARLADAGGILGVYGPYVAETAVSFEYAVPALEEFRGRMGALLGRYPYLVAEERGKILGYAYAGPFHSRPAFQWSAELTVYLAPEAQGRGLGRRLYECLECRLRDLGITDAYACIAVTDREDPALRDASVKFHAALGYETVGRFRNCGQKFGRWYDVLWMGKNLGPHENGLEKPKFP